MNITLWILQVLLAAHTIMGAVWKQTNSAQTVPSLQAIPHTAWLALSGLEVVCAIALVIPVFHRDWGFLISVAAALIALEMLIFCGLHLVSGNGQHGHMVYWLVVAALSGFIAYGRLVLRPL